MNDIDIKLVESPKEQLVGVEVSPASEVANENEIDPLSIDEEVSVKVELPDEIPEKGEDEICDDNAKESVIEPEKESNHLESAETAEVTDDLKKDSPQNTEENGVTDNIVAPKLDEEPAEKATEQPIVGKEPPSVAVEADDNQKVVQLEAEEKAVSPDVEMTEVQFINKEPKPSIQTINGDVSKEEQINKRRASQEVDTESPLKKLCAEVEKTFPQHDVMINDYIQTATKNNIDDIQRHTEQLLSEIQTLRELAQKKEHEWNNILHLKKVKEEILLRLLRRKQVLSVEKSADVNGSERTDPFDYLNQAKHLAIDKSDEISGLAIKHPGSAMINPIMQAPIMPVTSHFNPMSGLPPPYDKAAHLQSMPKPSQLFPQAMMMPGHLQGFPRDMNGQLPSSYGMPMGRQGPTKDVKSIIADYRQRNPEITPRRGRRMRPIANPSMMNTPRPIAPKVDSMSSLSNLNMVCNQMGMNKETLMDCLQLLPTVSSFPKKITVKDILMHFANVRQNNANFMPSSPMEQNRPEHHLRPERRRHERNEEAHTSVKQTERLATSSPRLPPPPPYPEISLLPVTTSQDTAQNQNSLLHGILTKNCGEITITPVQPAQPEAEKTEVVQLEEEESGASEESAGSASAGSGASGSGRLVIDEGADDAPTCQGCRARLAQFVCAGCANQWYCSRDCQVAAWDDHSEMCSG